MKAKCRSWPLFWVLLTSLVVFGCGDDDDEDDQHGEALVSPSCAEISESCHVADTGSGPAHDCHELAHEDVESDCVLAKEACLVSCAP